MTDFTYYINNYETDIYNIVTTLKEFGICVIPNYGDISELKKDVMLALEKSVDNYEFGEYVRFEGHNSYKSYKQIDNYFNNNFFKSILDKYSTNYKIFNESIFITKDYKSENKGRNGYLHFDRLRCFKFFVYLTDVTQNDGPFCIVPKSHILGNNLRKKSWNEESKYNKVKNRIRLDYPEIYNDKNITPIIGKAGTLIIFDTDLFHKGGETKGGERIVIRSHTYLK